MPLESLAEEKIPVFPYFSVRLIVFKIYDYKSRSPGFTILWSLDYITDDTICDYINAQHLKIIPINTDLRTI